MSRLMSEQKQKAQGALAQFDDKARPPEILFPPRNAELWAGAVDGKAARPFVFAGRGEGDLQWYVNGEPIPADAGGLPSWRPERARFYKVSAVDPVGRSSTVEIRVLGEAG